MRFARIPALCLLASCCTSDAWAQVVQLPTFSQFSIGTTVVVPDGGGVYLGGVTHSRYSSSSYGVPLFSGIPGLGRLTRSRASSFEMGGSHAFATAKIHDMDTLDRAVLAAAERLIPLPEADPATRERALFLSRNIGRKGAPGSGYATKSVWEINAARHLSGLSRGAVRKPIR